MYLNHFKNNLAINEIPLKLKVFFIMDSQEVIRGVHSLYFYLFIYENNYLFFCLLVENCSRNAILLLKQ